MKQTEYVLARRIPYRQLELRRHFGPFVVAGRDRHAVPAAGHWDARKLATVQRDTIGQAFCRNTRNCAIGVREGSGRNLVSKLLTDPALLVGDGPTDQGRFVFALL